LAITDDDVEAYVADLRAKRDVALAAAGTPVVLVRPLYVAIPAYLYPTALRVGWGAITRVLDDADRQGLDPQAVLVDLLLLRTREWGVRGTSDTRT
ncbi:MAG: hypothetical protein ACRCU1_15200, partial [Alsobacter sp.]